MLTFRDHFWLWGQEPQAHHRCDYRLPGVNTMNPVEGGRYLDIPNCCRVVMWDKPEPPFDEESEKLRAFRQVVWSAVGAGGVQRNNNDQSDLDEVLRQAELYDNVSGAVLDDFFASVEGFQSDGKTARHTLQSIRRMRERLHGFPRRKLDLWLVWYSYQLDYPVEEYVELCDVITLWTWNGSELADLDRNMERLVAKTPGKRRLAGCYMWNYGERMPLSREQMQHQLDRYHAWMREGTLEGVVFCSNCIADIGLEAVEMAREWIRTVGCEPVPSVCI